MLCYPICRIIPSTLFGIVYLYLALHLHQLRFLFISYDCQSGALQFFFLIFSTQALRVLRDHQMASVVMDCGRKLFQEVCDAQLEFSRFGNEAVDVRVIFYSYLPDNF